MANEICNVTSTEAKPWGKANPLRGANHQDTAIAFLREFPVGTTFTAEKFDEWAHAEGIVPEPLSTDRKSDAWKAHLQRRHELKSNINQAGSHPRMAESGCSPFVIEAIGAAVWCVKSPQAAISQNKLASRLESLTTTKKKQLAYLMQSADWSDLPPYERIFAESLYDDIEAFGDRIVDESQRLNDKFAKLQHKLKKAVESGDIRPSNGGIRGMIES